MAARHRRDLRRSVRRAAAPAAFLWAAASAATPWAQTASDAEPPEAAALAVCLAEAETAGAEPFACIGRVSEACRVAVAPPPAPETPPAACLDLETSGWDALSEAAARALGEGRAPDLALVAETRADTLAHRTALCAAAAEPALCRRDKAAERAIVFHRLLSLLAEPL